MENLIITGVSGLLGSNLALEAIEREYKVVGFYLNHPISLPGVTTKSVDISNKEVIEEIKAIQPDYIIHCASPTNLDYLEETPREAEKNIVEATQNIVDAARVVKAKLIHISTDAIFDGKKGDYKEDDLPNPINVYASAKLKAEKEVEKLENSIIIRTTIYGWNSQNKLSLAEWMLTKLRNNEELPSFYDIKFSPILVNDLSKLIFQLIEKEFTGTINLCARDPVTKLEFAQLIAKTFNLNQSLIKPTSSDTINFKAKRAKNMSLNTKKSQAILKLPTVEQGLESFKRLEEVGYSKKLKEYQKSYS